jgi:hypothetical protein
MLISIDKLQKKTTDSSYVCYDCRGATVGDRGSMAWMPAYIAVSNLRSMISMVRNCALNSVHTHAHWLKKLCSTNKWVVLHILLLSSRVSLPTTHALPINVLIKNAGNNVLRMDPSRVRDDTKVSTVASVARTPKFRPNNSQEAAKNMSSRK